jgi:general secretion pathway protein I
VGKRRAFSLLEILIALAVLAVVSMAVMGQGGESARQLSATEQRTLARWVAETEVAKLRLGRGASTEAPKLGTKRHRVVQGDRLWRVVRTTTQTPLETMFEVQIEVYAVQDGRDIGPIDTLTAYLGRF